MTAAEESRRVFADLKLNVSMGKENIMPYLSGTKNKRSMMYKEVARYEKDANIDYKLGIIKKEEYDREIKAIKMFEKALTNYSAY